MADDDALAEIEWCFRHRTGIETLTKDAEHGSALPHLPSAITR